MNRGPYSGDMHTTRRSPSSVRKRHGFRRPRVGEPKFGAPRKVGGHEFFNCAAEINSALIFGGAGSEPCRRPRSPGTNGDGWLGIDGLFSAQRRVVGEWLGPSSAAMATVAPYLGWLAAAAARLAVNSKPHGPRGQFRAVRAAWLQPALVAVTAPTPGVHWCSQLLRAECSDVATYEQMWAIDVSVMSAHHAGASAVASALAPFTAPPQNRSARPVGRSTARPSPGSRCAGKS